MRKVLVYCWSDQAANWIGKRMTLYADPSVKWAGIAVGGIRISHLSGIEKEISLMLSETRGKRKAYTVSPLVDHKPLTPFQQKWHPQFKGKPKDILALSGRIAAIKTVEESVLLETEINAVEDPALKKLLNDFATDVLAAL